MEFVFDFRCLNGFFLIKIYHKIYQQIAHIASSVKIKFPQNRRIFSSLKKG
jgi:hypothetical protein